MGSHSYRTMHYQRMENMAKRTMIAEVQSGQVSQHGDAPLQEYRRLLSDLLRRN